MDSLCVALLWPVKPAAEACPGFARLSLALLFPRVHSQRLLKVMDVRLAIQVLRPRELLRAQHTKVTVALSTSEQPYRCMREPVWKPFCI